MDKSEILQFIGAYIIPLVSAAVGWLAGSRKRRNDFLKDLQASIDLLSSENRRLLADITAVNAEIVALRKENEELKASVDRLSSENRRLLADITAVNAEIVAVRKENEELKASVDRLCSENSQLQAEVRQLREQIKRP